MSRDRIAAAPISWGVCEVPGWGVQLAPARVLDEMVALGLRATEAGPDGFLPKDPRTAASLLAERGMELAGAFVPVVLHREVDGDPLDPVRRAVAVLLEGRAAGAAAPAQEGDGGAPRAGAATSEHDGAPREGAAEPARDVLVLAATTGEDGYDADTALDEAAWERLLAGLDAARAVCAEAGVRCALHPHAGTLVERAEHVERVLAGSRVALCLDTGHLMVGGADPVAIAGAAADRISHVHLKDVDAALAARVAAGELPYSQAVRDGMYRPLGAGDVDVAAIVGSLEGAGYDGWYVLEQDVMLDAEPPAGAGPLEDVRASAELLRGVLAQAAHRAPAAPLDREDRAS